MTKILSLLISAFCLGLGLAALAGHLPVPAGVLGALLMLLAALAVRRRWGLLAEAAPGTPERQLWVSLGGTAVVAGHLLAALWHIGPRMVMHTPTVHALGIDSWTLVAGAAIAYAIARESQPRQDERDAWIGGHGLRAAHYLLVAVLLVQILALGFVNSGWIGELSHPSIAHGLILALLASSLADAITRLRLYARDAAAAHERAE
jgi:ABC-type amino acid transport system permease subunit